MNLDHIVISVSNLKQSIKFYSSFLGIAKITKLDALWKIGNTKLFLTSPYKKSAKRFDKHNLGLNHIALKVGDIKELNQLKKCLDKAKITHSGIVIDNYNKKNRLIWFNDPDDIRLEFYLRGK